MEGLNEALWIVGIMLIIAAVGGYMWIPMLIAAGPVLVAVGGAAAGGYIAGAGELGPIVGTLAGVAGAVIGAKVGSEVTMRAVQAGVPRLTIAQTDAPGPMAAQADAPGLTIAAGKEGMSGDFPVCSVDCSEVHDVAGCYAKQNQWCYQQ